MGKTGFNPADLVLEIQFLIRSSSSIIRLRISPAIEEIAAVAICSSSVACGFFCGGAVIYNPDFVTVMGTEEDLVVLGVVIDGVHVGPADVPPIVAVDVGEFRVVGDDAVVVLGGVKVLDHVIPDVPFPDNVPAGWSGLVDLDNKIGVEIAKPESVRVASFLDGLGGGFDFLHDEEEVTVGEDREVMGGVAAVSGIVIIPENGAIVGDFLDSTTTGVDGEVHGAVMIYVGIV